MCRTDSAKIDSCSAEGKDIIMKRKAGIENAIAVLMISLMLVVMGFAGNEHFAYALSNDADADMFVEVPDENVVISSKVAENLPDSDEALGMYIDELAGTEVFANSDQKPGKNAGSKLTGKELMIYEILLDRIKEIAAGNAESTEVDIPLADVLGGLVFTESELGIEIYDDEAEDWDMAAVKEAVSEILSFDNQSIINALLTDCPYELYWYDKTEGLSTGYPGASLQDVGEAAIVFDQDACLTFSFAPAKEYSNGYEFEVDTDKTSVAKNAVENARAIVDQNEALSDYGKINAYKDKICELTEYNYDAVRKDYDGGYGNPWQLIYVFDGDDSTNVVCEGYSKAFKLLCDMSEFESDSVHARTVWGNCGGAHMWNVVTMDDDMNYVADITNTDGANPDYAPFLAGADGSVASEYLVHEHYRYSYDKDMFSLFSNEELEISDEDYVPEDTPDYNDGAVTGIQVNLTKSPIEITEGTNCKLVTYLDEDTQVEYTYYKYDLPNLRDYMAGLIVTFENGVDREYSWNSKRDAFTCKGKDDIAFDDIFESIYSDQNFDNEWKGGESHEIILENEDYLFRVPVVIKHEYVKKTVAAKIGIAGKKYEECTICGDIRNVVTLKALSPAKTTIKSLSKGKKSFTVKWTKKTYTGYQIRYSTKSSMSGAKTVTVTKSSTVSKTVKNLKAKKKYYVQIRTYKTVSGKKYYSAWSTKKSVTTK